MINIVQNGDLYEISFRYDPELINMVKNVTGRRWNAESKFWTIPTMFLGTFLVQLQGTQYEQQVKIESYENIGVNEHLDVTQEIPDIDISDVNFQVAPGLHPYHHQYDFMKFSIYRQMMGNMNGFVLADEQGLAKTIEIANIAMYNREHYGFKHCLIIACVNSAKYNWREDIIKHTEGREVPYLLGSRLRRDKSGIRSEYTSENKLIDLQTGKMFGEKDGEDLPFFIILNIEALRYKSGRKDQGISYQISKLVNEGYISMIALDEIHKNASPQSQQGKQILKIKKATKDKAMWFPMTGTPIVNKPTDVFLPLYLVGGHTFDSYYTWNRYFCVYGGYNDREIIGYRNIPYLKSLLEPNMLRRLKVDVLDLPEKIQYTEYVENSEYQNKLYQAVRSDMQSRKATIAASPNWPVQFLRLRQVNEAPELVDTTLEKLSQAANSDYLARNAKMQRLVDLVDEILERDEKVVIFSNWVEPLRTVYRILSRKNKVCVFTGTMKSDEREQHKQAFIQNKDCKILIGTIGALGVSHTLTVARNVIFLDEPWTPSDKVQAEDRCHRSGTTETVNIYTLISKGTVDERVHDILYQKQGTSDYIVDNRLDLKAHPELFDILLS